MDALAALLDGPRARGAFLMQSVLDPPWSLRIRDEAPLTLIALMRGEAHIVTDPGECLRLVPGDVAVVRGPQPFTIADSPATAPQITIWPGQVTTAPDGEVLCEAMSLGIRTWGTNPDGQTLMVTGTYETVGAVGEQILRALPRVLALTADDLDSPLLSLLSSEMSKDDPGQGVVLDRLLDLLLVTALRTWLDRAESTAWYRAHTDAVVGKSIRLLQNNPQHRWTVESLAAEVGVSRASFAERFTRLVGQSPIQFLTQWRLALAADLLLASDDTIDAIAHRVGYGSSFALSTAFKRRYGVSPRAFRVRPASRFPASPSHP